jgi:MFS family permease
VARYGPKLPLILGPLVVALGFVLFATPSVGGSYWKEFFPPVVVLGLGMAITVAPLTTVVMNSVSQDRVGAASGINNAVARVAGVLAIAVLGIVMVNAFGSRLNQTLVSLSLSPGVLQAVQSEETKLAGLPIPANIDLATTAAIKEAIATSFVFGFRVVMLICAGLAVASSAAAGFMIPNGTSNSPSVRSGQ